MEKKLTEVLKNFSILTSIKKKSLDEIKADLSGPVEDSAHRKLFIDTINTLEEIEEKSGELFEAGVDLSAHEMLFFQVIENLFYIIYNDKQVNLIHSYIYGEPLSDMIPQPVDKDGKVLEPETPEELWNALHKVR